MSSMMLIPDDIQYALADKYDFKDLKVVAAEKFKHALSQYCAISASDPGVWGSVTEIARLTELMSIISIINSSIPKTDRLLRDIVAHAIPEFWPEKNKCPISFSTLARILYPRSIY